LLETTKKIKTRKSPVASPKSPTTRPQTKKKTPTSLRRKTMAKSPIKRAESKQPRALKKKLMAKSPMKKTPSKKNHGQSEANREIAYYRYNHQRKNLLT